MLHIQTAQNLRHTHPETLPVLIGTARPGHLGRGDVARERHPLRLFAVGNILRPEAGLVTYNIFLAQVGNGIHRRIIVVHLLQGHKHLLRQVVRLVVLMVVKVAPAVRGQHHADAAADTASCGGVAAVGHCDRILQGAAVQDLIPADDGLAVLLEEIANTLHEEGLELLDVLETEHLHKVLAVLALTIHILRGLVAADVVVRRREEFEQFREHILQELEGAGSRSIEVLPDAPAGFHLIAALGEAA